MRSVRRPWSVPVYAGLLAGAAALGGCVTGGLHSSQPPQARYLLSLASVPGAAAASADDSSAAVDDLAAARSLRVLLPAAAPGLDGDGIAVLHPGGQLDDYAGARWAAPAPQMVQTLAIESLRRTGHFSLVQSDSAPFEADWVLQLELTHFEADYAQAGPPTVRVALVATLGQRSARRAVMTLTIDTHALAQSNRMHAVVDAFESATRQALRQLDARLAPPGAR